MGKDLMPYKAVASLALDRKGRQVINVLVKKTYVISHNRKAYLSEIQLGFIEEDEMKPKETEPGWYPVSEMELVPWKVCTDIVVTGDVVAPGQKPVGRMKAGITMGSLKKTVEVFGNRFIEMTSGGSLKFTPPEPFVSMPMSYTLAYGGVDPAVPRNENPKTAGQWLEYLTLERHPGVYPRNPVGQAYVVNNEKWLLNGRPLPNFEDPANLLNPERIVVGNPELWWLQPMPAGLSWFGRSWYPRSAHAGILPPFPPDEKNIAETKMGLVTPDHVTKIRKEPLHNYPEPLFFNGASPGLGVTRIRGDEIITVSGMDEKGDMVFQLPGDDPHISISFDKKPLEITDKHIHTLWIKKDENIMTMIWSACAYAPRMLPVTLPTKENPVYNELEKTEIYVDGILIEKGLEKTSGEKK